MSLEENQLSYNKPKVPQDSYLHGEPSLRYTIVLPHYVDVSSPQPGITRYRYIGPKSEPGSEITDGYTITIVARTTSASSTELLAAQEIQGQRSTIIEGPVSDQLADQHVSRFTAQSELGNKPIEHYALIPDNGFEYIVSVNISPYENNEYRQEVETILETLTFLSSNEASSLESRIIPIAMLDYESVSGSYVKESNGKERGCDKVVIIDYVLEEDTTTPLTQSLTQLFAYNSDMVAGWQNFIASQNSTLLFDRVYITEGVAHIYLTGELGSLGGVCDNPRAAIQIEETALAYPTVNSVQLYLNNEPTNLTPDGRGNTL